MNRKILELTLVGVATLAITTLASAAADASYSGRGPLKPSRLNREDPQVVTLAPMKDNTLYESMNGDTSNGRGAHVFVGNSNSEVVRRAVLEFDVASAIPANAEVDRVTLSLHMSRTSSGAQTIRLYHLSQEWGESDSNADANEGGGAPAAEGDATWLHTYYDDQNWSKSGGDFVGAPSASTTVADAGRYEWSSEQMEDEVESWLAEPSGNHGWILIGIEQTADGQKARRTSKRFDSRENADEDVRPMLTVEFRVDDGTATPETSTPETSTPETSTPETSTPETSTPETSTPETSTPETSTPETSTPETPTPEAPLQLMFLPIARNDP
jgi:hypothetical protein